MQPLLAELTLDDTKTRVGLAVRDCLEKSGIQVDGFSVQPYDGVPHTADQLEDQVASGQRGDALLVLVPQLSLSKDQHVLTLTAQSRIYPSASSVPSAECAFSRSSAPLDGDDPISRWSAADGSEFFSELDAESAELCVQIAGMFR
jgi:hypothetical protein